MTVAAYVPDLMDRSRIEAAVTGVVFVRTPAALAEAVADADVVLVVLVDLARPGVLEVLASLGPVRTIGFASHVDTDLIERARAAGCTDVLARSAFFSRLPALLG